MPLLFRCKYIFYIVLIKIYKHLYFICLLFRHLPLYTFNDHYFWWLHMLLPCSLRTEKLRERNRLFPESWAWASIQDSSLAPTCSVAPRCHDGMFPRIASCPRRGWKNRGWGVEENTVARRARHFPCPWPGSLSAPLSLWAFRWRGSYSSGWLGPFTRTWQVVILCVFAVCHALL